MKKKCVSYSVSSLLTGRLIRITVLQTKYHRFERDMSIARVLLTDTAAQLPHEDSERLEQDSPESCRV